MGSQCDEVNVLYKHMWFIVHKSVDAQDKSKHLGFAHVLKLCLNSLWGETRNDQGSKDIWQPKLILSLGTG